MRPPLRPRFGGTLLPMLFALLCSVAAHAVTQPVVSIAAPAPSTNFIAPATITVRASASDTERAISKVEFYLDGEALPFATQIAANCGAQCYAASLPGMPIGSYTLKAKAYDDVNPPVTSTGVTVIVNAAPVSPPLLDIDLDGRVDALTDGLIVLRYLFGLAGSQLTQGTTSIDALRSDPGQVTAYLESIYPALDVDGNGQSDALTDGLLIIRYTLGLRGPSLIQGAIGTGATRLTAPDIEAYLAVPAGPWITPNPPMITGFSPIVTNGPVTITGTGFDADPANDRVSMGGVVASVSAATTTIIDATAGAGTPLVSFIKVRTPNGIAVSADPLYVLPAAYDATSAGALANLVIDGATVSLPSTGAAGRFALLHFEGTAGQQLGLGISQVAFNGGTTSLAITVLSPGGSTYLSASVPAAGASFVLPTLASSGVYLIILQPQGGGSASLSATLSTDANLGALNFNGTSYNYLVTRPGQVGFYSFPAATVPPLVEVPSSPGPYLFRSADSSGAALGPGQPVLNNVFPLVYSAGGGLRASLLNGAVGTLQFRIGYPDLAVSGISMESNVHDLFATGPGDGSYYIGAGWTVQNVGTVSTYGNASSTFTLPTVLNNISCFGFFPPPAASISTTSLAPGASYMGSVSMNVPQGGTIGCGKPSFALTVTAAATTLADINGSNNTGATFIRFHPK